MGWEDMAHGGMISTVLDEIMSYAVIAYKRDFFVTRKMTVDYLKPVPLNVPLTAQGQIDPKNHTRGCYTKGSIVTEDGIPLASARAEMVFLSAKKAAQIPKPLRDDMLRLFEKL